MPLNRLGAHGPVLWMPSRHVACVRWTIGARRIKPIIEIGINMVSLHEPHQVHSVCAAGKAAVGLVDVVADRLGAGEAFVADSDGAGAIFGF